MDYRPKVTIPTILLTNLLIAYTLGEIVPSFLVITICIPLLIYIYNVIKNKSFHKFTTKNLINQNLSISIAIISACLVQIILPFVLLHNYFISINWLILIFGIPIIFTFFVTHKLTSNILNNQTTKIPIKKYIGISAIICLVFMLICLGTISYIMVEKLDQIKQSYQEADINYINYGYLNTQNEGDLQIIEEIKEIVKHKQDKQIEAKHKLVQIKNKNPLCLIKDCSKIVRELVFQRLDDVVTIAILTRSMDVINTQSKVIKEEKYNESFSSIEDYKDQINQIFLDQNYSINPSEKTEIEKLKLLNSDITYNELINELNQGSHVNILDIPDLKIQGYSQEYSILGKSQNHILAHTTQFRELTLLIITVEIYTRNTQNDTIINPLYKNINIEESDTSKISRYLIILDSSQYFKDNKNDHIKEKYDMEFK